MPTWWQETWTDDEPDEDEDQEIDLDCPGPEWPYEVLICD